MENLLLALGLCALGLLLFCYLWPLLTGRSASGFQMGGGDRASAWLKSLGIADPNVVITTAYDERTPFQKMIQADLTEHDAVLCPTPSDPSIPAFCADKAHRLYYPETEAPNTINQALQAPDQQTEIPEVIYTPPQGDYPGPNGTFGVLPANALLYEKPMNFTSEYTRLFDYFTPMRIGAK